jgi:hypothetical protein
MTSPVVRSYDVLSVGLETNASLPASLLVTITPPPPSPSVGAPLEEPLLEEPPLEEPPLDVEPELLPELPLLLLPPGSVVPPDPSPPPLLQPNAAPSIATAIHDEAFIRGGVSTPRAGGTLS